MTAAAKLIKGGRIFRAAERDFTPADVLIEGMRIRAVGADLQAPVGAEVIDATGALVTPGLIDFHMHAFRYGHFLSIDADEVAHRSGTTTFVDAGSAGSLHFMAFRDYVIRPAKANILAFLNVSAIGQTTDGVKGLGFHDNDHDSLLHLESAEEVIARNRDVIVGIKVRAYTGLPSMLPMQRARELAERTGLPIMVHLAPAPPEFGELLPYLGEGDIITHPYHGGASTILDDDGRIRPEYWEARRRGIEVDLGLDRFHGDLAIMRAAFEQGFLPDYISTDLAATNLNSIVFDLPTTIAKVVACGMPLADAIARSTIGPGKQAWPRRRDWRPARRIARGHRSFRCGGGRLRARRLLRQPGNGAPAPGQPPHLAQGRDAAGAGARDRGARRPQPRQSVAELRQLMTCLPSADQFRCWSLHGFREGARRDPRWQGGAVRTAYSAPTRRPRCASWRLDTSTANRVEAAYRCTDLFDRRRVPMNDWAA